MFDWFNSAPAEYCCLLLPRIVRPMIVADLAIALSYFAIGGWFLLVALKTSPYGKVIQGGRLLLGLFIVFCGLGHLVDVIKIWYPVCDSMVVIRLATAAVSVLTWIWAWKHKKDFERMFGVTRKP